MMEEENYSFDDETDEYRLSETDRTRLAQAMNDEVNNGEYELPICNYEEDMRSEFTECDPEGAFRSGKLVSWCFKADF